jgi:DNA-binding NarL/FixJ family response regulator
LHRLIRPWPVLPSARVREPRPHDYGGRLRKEVHALTAEPRPIRVLLVDDHQLLTGALSQVLSREPDIEVMGIAGSVADAKAIARDQLDVVLMDYRLPDGTGADAARAIKSRWPNARVVMLTALADDETILESIQAGADGYLTKDRAVEDVVSGVRSAYAGETLLPRAVIVGIAQRVAAARDRGDRQHVEPLTPRETEVLRALAEGLSTPEICERLFIAPNTLRTHVQNIMGKLRVHSKLEAVAFALRHRLVEPPRYEDALY